MPGDVYVTSIVFKTDDLNGDIAYIQVFFSNGSRSPVFQAQQDYGRSNEQTIVLDEVNRPVKKIIGGPSFTSVKWASFIDVSGAEIAKYNPE